MYVEARLHFLVAFGIEHISSSKDSKESEKLIRLDLHDLLPKKIRTRN